MKSAKKSLKHRELTPTRAIRIILAILFVSGFATSHSQAQTVTKIVDNGPDGEKLVFAILGDGYKASDLPKYQEDISRLVINGLFGHDFFRDNQRAFNLYRVDLTSRDSGVSTPTTTKDTALKIIYTGVIERCWLEESPDTDRLINEAVRSIPAEYVLIIANETGFGGCRRGNRLYVTSGDARHDYWQTVAHEYGHGVGNLLDEYSDLGPHTGGESNTRNCSTVLNRTRVVWRQHIAPTTVIPTTLSAGMDPNQTVGMFEGCNRETRRIYRPVDSCRMRSPNMLFCPVCLDLITRAVRPYLGDPAPNPAPPTERSSRNSNSPQDVTRQPSNSSAASGPQGPTERESYIKVMIKVKKNGPSEIIKADEVQGRMILRTEPMSDFIYELRRDNATLAAEFLPEDPFIVRGFADPNNNRGEYVRQVDSAIITIKLPKSALITAPNSRIDLQLYKIRAETVIERLDTQTLNRLKNQGRLTLQLSVPSNRLGPAILQQMNRR